MGSSWRHPAAYCKSSSGCSLSPHQEKHTDLQKQLGDRRPRHHTKGHESGNTCNSHRHCKPQGAPGLSSLVFRVLRYAGDHYGANRNSGRKISNSGPEMCIPLFLRPKSKPAGCEKPIRVAAIRVVTKYIGCSTTLGITTVQIEILGAKFQVLGPRCAPHYFSGPSQNLLDAKNRFA